MCVCVTVSLFMRVHQQCGDICMDSWYMGQVYCKKWLYWIEQNCFITFYSPALLPPSYLLEILTGRFTFLGENILQLRFSICASFLIRREMWISRSEHETVRQGDKNTKFDNSTLKLKCAFGPSHQSPFEFSNDVHRLRWRLGRRWQKTKFYTTRH